MNMSLGRTAFLRLPALLGALLLATTAAFGDSGRIIGRVIDSETGDALIGAFVVVRNPDGTGTPFGSATDLAGEFRIGGVPMGSYTVEGSMIGYNRTSMTEVAVVSDGTVSVDFLLQSEAISLDEVVVQARAVRNTGAALLKERQKASAVSDAISAEDISRAGSGDAAEAMSHVTGATVQDGK